MTASFEDPDPVLGFDMVFNSNQTLDQISVPPGDMVEVEWNVTYSGSLEERTAALFVTLDSENDDVIIPGGYSFDVSVFDSTDTDQERDAGSVRNVLFPFGKHAGQR